MESTLASVCVAIFGTWSSGKSFVWRLNKAELENNGWEALTDKIKKELDDLLATTLDRCWVSAFAAWCWVARNLVRLFCCCSARTLKEEEVVATMMILSVPIGLPVWIVVFSVSMLVLFAKHMFVKTLILLRAPFRGVADKYYANPDAEYRGTWEYFFRQKMRLKKKDNDVVIPDDLIVVRVIRGIVSAFKTRKYRCTPKKQHGDEENQPTTSPITHECEMKWSQVRGILTGETDLYADSRDFEHIIFLGRLQIIFLISFQKAYKIFQASASSMKFLFFNDYEIEESMTKYIFVEFNVSCKLEDDT